MAIAFDATSNSGDITGASATWAHTVGGSERVLYVAGGSREDGLIEFAAATWNGSATGWNYIATAGHADVGPDSAHGYFLAPTATTANIVVTFIGTIANGAGLGAISLTGVHQTTPLDASIEASGTSANGSTSLTVSQDAWIVAGFYFDDNATTPTITSGTERWSFAIVSAGRRVHGGHRGPLSAGSNSIGWTHVSDRWIIVAAAFKTATASGGTTPPVGQQLFILP